MAATIVASSGPDVAALALVSPALRLASVVAANERRFGVTYQWSDESREVAAEYDFVARAPELAAREVPTLLVVGGDDEEDGVIRPAEHVRDAFDCDRVEASLARIPGMAHALADEPGLKRAAQTPAAAAVDATVARWLVEHLP